MHQPFNDKFNVFTGTFSELSRMVLVNVMTFVVLEILYNLVLMQKFCLQIIADINKVWESVYSKIVFTFSVLLALSLTQTAVSGSTYVPRRPKESG